VTFSRDNHSVKLGVDFSHIPFADDALYNLNGYYVFPTDQFLDGSPQSIANLKNPSFFGASVPAVNSSLPTQHLAWFIQDTWRPTAAVTVDFGLRYDRQFGSFNEGVTLDPRVVAAVRALGSTVDPQSRGDKNNFGPRVGAVWDVEGKGRSVVRAGFGVYYDNIRTLNNMIGEQRNFSQFTIAIVNPPYPDPYQGKDPVTFASTGPANLNVLSDDFKNPQAENYSVGVTQKINAELSIHIDGVYVHSRGDRIKYDLNLPNPVTGIRPLPQYGFIDQDRSILESNYKATFIRLDKRLSHRYTFLVSYTLAKADDVGSRATNNGGFFHVTDQSNPSLDEGPSDTDRRHSVVASGTAILPWDLTLGAVWTYRSAAPFSAYSANFSADGQQQYVPGTSRNQGNRDLNLAAVSAYRAQNGLGPVSADQIQTDRLNSVDVRFAKAIRLSGQAKLELIAQVFNLLGTDNLNAPFSGGQVTSALSSSFGQILTAKNRHQGELGMRLAW
jgi:hypothetical protein